MNKIYFAPNWGLSSQQMSTSYIKQSPGNSGEWEDVCLTLSVEDADYLVVEDNCEPSLLAKFPPSKILYFSREALDFRSHSSYPKDRVKRFSYWDGSGYLYTKWIYPGPHGGIGLSYDHLAKESRPPKTKSISCVQTDKQMTPTHVARKAFIAKCSESFAIDIYGSIDCSNCTLKDNDKKNALDDHRYSLAFDNQITIKDFFGTQFTDALLRWTVPIYGGGADLEKYFPPKSFIKIDPFDLKYVDEVKKIIENEDYEGRIEDVNKARDLILNKYNIWPTIKKVIDK